MATYKCKMCGGNLEVIEKDSVVECEYCGAKQTIPTSDDEALQKLFNRANLLRIKCDFDKAEEIYEKVIQKDETQAEAYWGLILCKYGIEYVEEPNSFERIPTCHRTSYESIMTDEDYKLALDNADALQKAVFEKEAVEIERIQKEILALANKEEPYDVFICYKEKDEVGNRTQDSVIANDIYYQLTNEGLKVFYAAITLEDKLGSAYEPCIFAALNTAKVMLVVGTRPEFFEAVWVKNEWSRYMKLMKSDRSKMLIPCYRDMDAYELPEDFAHLQAQDMSKIGFINDVVRGIQKMISKKTKATKEVNVAQNITVNAGVNINGNLEAFIKRGYMALADEEYKKANDFFEQALNFDAENAEAYLGKAMAQEYVSKKENLCKEATSLISNKNYKKALDFADDAMKQELMYAVHEEVYKKSLEVYEKETSIKEVVNARKWFEILNEYKDSKNLVEKGKDIIERLEKENLIQFEEKRNKLRITSQSIALRFGYLKLDGTVVLADTGEFGRVYAQDWENVVAISEGYKHIVGLKSDGTVIADGDNAEGQCNVQGWKDIVAISAGHQHTVGLKSNGTVIAGGDNAEGQCNVQDWKGIVAISAGYQHTVGLRNDGTVVAVGDERFGRCDVEDWENIVAISTGGMHTVGLRVDGTVAADGRNYEGQCDVEDWENIVAVSAGYKHTVGLRADGTVVAGGCNYEGQCDVEDWKDIVAVFAGDAHTAGLRTDGTVVVVGDSPPDVSKWRLFQDFEHIEKERKETLKIEEEKRQKREEVVKELKEKRNYLKKASSLIAAGDYYTIGVKKNGTVVKVGCKVYGESILSKWKDIVAVSAGYNYLVGLKADRTVVAVGNTSNGLCDVSYLNDIVSMSVRSQAMVGIRGNGTVFIHGNILDDERSAVSKWKNIVAVSKGAMHTVGLRNNGTVVAVPEEVNPLLSLRNNDGIVVGVGTNIEGQCNVQNWRNIIAIATGSVHTVGLRDDGTVVATGYDEDNRCKVSGWKNIVAISAGDYHTVGLRADGTVVAAGTNTDGQCNVSGWKNIVAISAGKDHTVGLRADGTVVVVGHNYHGQCKVSGWKLFDNYDNLEEEARICNERMEANLCQHCGGSFKGLFTKTCVNCGKQKDY